MSIIIKLITLFLESEKLKIKEMKKQVNNVMEYKLCNLPSAIPSSWMKC